MNEEKWTPENKCKDCAGLGQDEEVGYYCMATLCCKEYDYDPEMRIYTQKKLKIKNFFDNFKKFQASKELHFLYELIKTAILWGSMMLWILTFNLITLAIMGNNGSVGQIIFTASVFDLWLLFAINLLMLIFIIYMIYIEIKKRIKK